MVILDTNVIIDHLRQEKGQETLLKRLIRNNLQEDLAISIISIQELYRGQSTKDSEKENNILTTVSALKILSYSYEAAELAGKLARDSKGTIEFADAAIAATALVNNGSLATLNKKDFVQIPNLELLDI
ncbi:MAG: hypothetical protein A3H72_00975 [Candidatus Doudnabacteria bacterium RIFCSPLOWO2_02_FULL_48_8]|uniref:Ribonuclease VapC n=1 Tax=Candidatus Doudnabacteria bacterium RIFCSPHIGHO2_01_FULL_46_24 TaxID=1817825 RepID=A0A1F5NVM0_9BACT|nr:MAG: hypothetical protein A2720_00775 [Candidatus Doudnabacteria bacterium RIFCSPHIGHO2_01_FULL_46_24]OGE95404.1 MAG: hypothetical protein A3H72_00975 [Candidatus Doudnabacteria bacterium RIFCSPLOWO2_02_FULL_48_8]OGE96002.1 MAG: hypothetical protein A3E98_04240 [Candidatus Doudnabacteria bacterium RIFCSPHIGHO2_12_FULL_48_11]